MLRKMLDSDPDIRVIDTATDAYDAKDKIIAHDPDVITLDVEMPRMDGITFLKLIMERRPRPVIILSALTASGSEQAMEALQAGAFEVLGKPGASYQLENLRPLLIQSIKSASQHRRKQPPHYRSPTQPAAATGRLTSTAKAYNTRQILLIGASTGGTEAIKQVFLQLPEFIPPTLIVQHIPPHFSTAFATRLNHLCPFEVKEAEDGDEVIANRALLAPGDFHMTLERSVSGFCVRLNQGPKIWHQRPAVDILFKSAARLNVPQMVGTILTGMGKDGAEGLKELRDIGCKTFNQDEASCVVYGMPRAAWEMGASQKQVPIDQMAQTLIQAIG